ncbi:MAG: quinone-dependent dihydroorotate dehydrogenase [Trueperella sp.]|nr:quinone-dependent dihydroorotate dehydrogenase [Trueperella sp.]
MYRLMFKLFISKTDPEQAHNRVMRALALFGKITPVAALARRVLRWGYPSAHYFNRQLTGRVGLAAGLDKDAIAVRGLDALGFAFVEVGTITPKPQPGNDQPRLWRHLADETIRNRMGFNNDGADACAARLAQLRATAAGKQAVVGVNIGKNKWTSAAAAPNDYAYAAEKLAPYADYLVINVSSPNTPGLRDLQAVESLTPIVRATIAGAQAGTSRPVPVLVKIAPDLADADIAKVAALVKTEQLAGVVATNTTIGHDRGPGGLSGPILLPRSTQVVADLRRELGPDFLIIGVGGVTTAADAKRMVAAGADLVQIYTSFIYHGAFLPSKLNRALR